MCRYFDCTAAARISVTADMFRDLSENGIGTKTKLPYNPLALVDVLKDMLAGAKWSVKAPASVNQEDHSLFLNKMNAWYSNIQKTIPPRFHDLQGIYHISKNMDKPTERNMHPDEQYCDMMVDWWPEQFEYPAGYHPTLPCMNRDAAHRTYDQVFAARRADGSNDPDSHIDMVYMPLDIRDAHFVHNHFGVEGICRATNYDLDMAEINTARICTRQRMDPTHDPSVPKSAHQFSSEFSKQWGTSQCADSSKDVPWFVEDAHTNTGMLGKGILSMGTIPLFSVGQMNFSRQAVYPPPLFQKKLRLWGVQQSFPEGLFGTHCTHARLPDPCSSDSQCEVGYRCHSIAKICVKTDSSKCYVHQDCLQSEYMCSGDGTCVQPAISVRNEHPSNESMEFRIYSENCPSDGNDMHSVDMYGLSPWERVPDLLYAHGLCSYRNWYEYQQSIARSPTAQARTASCLQNTATVSSSPFCEVNGGEDSWFFTSNAEKALVKGMYRQQVLRQESHACDRDYMHLGDNFKSCMKIQSQIYWKGDNDLFLNTPTALSSLQANHWLRFYQPGSSTLRLAAMLGVTSNPKYGFLGRPLSAPSATTFNAYTDFGFQRCLDEMQCYAQVRGVHMCHACAFVHMNFVLDDNCMTCEIIYTACKVIFCTHSYSGRTLLCMDIPRRGNFEFFLERVAACPPAALQETTSLEMNLSVGHLHTKMD